jgi:hypothetical protein
MKSKIAKGIETIASEVRGAMEAARGRVIGLTEALWSRRPTALIESVNRKRTRPMLQRLEAVKTKVAKTIGAPANAKAKTPTRPKAAAKRAAQPAGTVERLKKTVTPTRAAARRSSAKPGKTKVAESKKTSQRAKPV